MKAIEAQRAVIQGEYQLNPGSIYVVKARLVVPPNATILEAPNVRLTLSGFWDPNRGYTPLGLSPAIPMGPENQFNLEVQPDSEDDPFIVSMISPRTIILKDTRVFRGLSPTGDPDNDLVREYVNKYLNRGRQ